MKNKKTLCKVLSLVMASSLIFSAKVQALDVTAQTNDIHKQWTIKFNEDIKFDNNVKNEIKITNEKGNEVDSQVELKDSKVLTILAPKDGYKDGEIYTLTVSNNIKSSKNTPLKGPKSFSFKVDTKAQPYNNGKYLYKDIVNKTIDGAVKQICDNDVDGDWEMMALVKNNTKVPDECLQRIKDSIKKGEMKQPTDYERTVMALTAVGENPLDFDGVNLVEKIYNNKDITTQGINAAVFALISLDTKNFDVPQNAVWTRDALIEYILKNRTSDGGWDYGGIKVDPDMTGMAINSLSLYKDRPEVKSAIDNAVKLLSKIQNEDGTFSCYGVENSESISQVIIGLCANGIDPTSKEFTKNGVNLIEALLTFKTEDGGFCHIYDTGSNGMSTEQATLALETYREFKNGRNHIYKF